VKESCELEFGFEHCAKCAFNRAISMNIYAC